MRDFEPIHPGEILSEEFLKPMAITQTALARHLDISKTYLRQVIQGKRAITADFAVRLAYFFDMEAEFWLNLQMRYDLIQAKSALITRPAPFTKHSPT